MPETPPDDEELTAAEELAELLEVVVEALGLDAEVGVEESTDVLVGTVDGEDVALLIGRHGQTIEAVQHLAQRILLREGSGPRVVVDAGGYRAEREAALRTQADEAAAAALSSGEAVPLAAMSAAERRYVHEHLRERGEVETHSEGQEPERRLIVTPPTP